MTVSNQISRSGPYLADGIVTTFNRTFKLLDAGHIRIVQTVAGVDSDITSGFTQTGVPGDTGTVVFNTAPADGAQITLYRVVPVTQESDYSSQGSVDPEVIERDLDLVAMRQQDQQDSISRSLRAPVGDTLNFELPRAADRALRALIFDASGRPTAGTATSGLPIVSAFGETLIAAADKGSARKVLGLGAMPRTAEYAAALAAEGAGTIGYLGGYAYRVDPSASGTASCTNDLSVNGLVPHGSVYPQHFGVVAGSATDVTAALQAALNAAAGKTLVIPPGVYLFSAPGLSVSAGTTVLAHGAILRVAAGTNSMTSNRAVRLAGSDILWDGGEIDFNRANQIAGFDGLVGQTSADRCTIKNLTLRGAPGRSFMSNGDVDSNPAAIPSEDINEYWRVENVTVLNSPNKCIQIRQTHYATVANCFCQTNATGLGADDSASGFEASRSFYVDFTNCSVEHLVAEIGPSYRVVNGSRHVRFVGGSSLGGRQGQFCTDSGNVKFIGQSIVNPGFEGCLIGAVNLDNIAGRGQVFDVLVQGNTYRNPVGDGIEIYSSNNGEFLRDVRIIGNAIDGGAGTTYGIRNRGDLTGGGTAPVRRPIAQDNIIRGVTSKYDGDVMFDGRLAAVVADDSVWVIPLVEELLRDGVLALSVLNVPAFSSMFAYRTGNATGMVKIAGDAGNRVDAATGALTGTTGTDTNIRISAANAGGSAALHVENRTGEPRKIVIQLLASSEVA